MHHHVMAVDGRQIVIWRLGDVPDQPDQKDAPRSTQVACGAWVLTPNDERLPTVLRNCSDGVYVLMDGGSTQDDIAAVFSRWGLEAPGFVTISGLKKRIQERLHEVNLAEQAARQEYRERLGRKPSWRPIPWPGLHIDTVPPAGSTSVEGVLQLVRQIERCFDTWDEIESQRLKRRWLTVNEAIGGRRRLQIKGLPEGWRVFAVEKSRGT